MKIFRYLKNFSVLLDSIDMIKDISDLSVYFDAIPGMLFSGIYMDDNYLVVGHLKIPIEDETKKYRIIISNDMNYIKDNLNSNYIVLMSDHNCFKWASIAFRTKNVKPFDFTVKEFTWSDMFALIFFILAYIIYIT